jgi:glycosyltransferase involved in cell wall biosynthesis
MLPLRARPRLGLASAAVSLAAWIRRHKPDLIHPQLIRASMVSRMAAVLSGWVPVATTWDNAYYNPDSLPAFRSSVAYRWLVRWLDRISSPVDRRFIAVSRHVADHCCEQLGIAPARVRVVSNAVAPERYTPTDPVVLAQTRRDLGLADDAEVVLSVGRLAAQKAHHDTIEAMVQVVRSRPRAVLLIAGGGPLEPPLRDRVRARDAGAFVKILGRRSDVPALYQLADVFASSSLFEGHSLALIEALANGLPAVVSDIPSNQEVVADLASVRCVPVRDPAAMATTLAAVLADKQAMRSAAEALRNPIRARYSVQEMARRVGEVFEESVAS